MNTARLALALALVCAALPLRSLPAVAEEPVRRDPGNLFLTYENSDFHGDRFATELGWVGPLADFLIVEAGARYWHFAARREEDALAGYGILGAVARLPTGRDQLYARYEHGAGRASDDDRFQHLIGMVGWEHELLEDWLFADTELRLIRVDDVSENLVKLGAGVAPTRWLLLKGGWFTSVFGGEGTEVWTARADLYWRESALFFGYTRSEDTIDLSSIGRSRNTGADTDEYRVGLTLPIGRHGITLVGTRFESRFDERHTLGVTFRWALPERWGRRVGSD